MKKDERGRGFIKLVFIILFFVLILIGAVSIPFFIDILYGQGKLAGFKFIGLYDNSFPAEVWFSFIGSYFPATILGILTIYQAFIIQRQERRYKELQNRHRYNPESHADMYRFSNRSGQIGKYKYTDLNNMFNLKHSLEDWKSGFIVKCMIYDSIKVGIAKVEPQRVECIINKKSYYQKNPEKMFCCFERFSHSKRQLVFYFTFDEIDEKNEVDACMRAKIRRNEEYKMLQMNIVLKVEDALGEKSTIEVSFRYMAQDDDWRMLSVEEWITSLE